MKKTLALILALLMVAFAFVGCAAKKTEEAPAAPAVSDTAAPEADESATPDATESEAPVADKGVLMMATTTSTDNTGLLDYLAPLFKEDTGWELQWTAVGTGAALQMGMDGEVDVVLVHSKAKEEAFVSDGYGVERFEVMYNDYVVVGPADGPIAKTNDINAVFTTILDDSLTFVSRGDDSGTHTKETGIWKKLEMDYESNPNYVSAGAGMTDTIIMADEMEGYCLSDRGTWLSTKLNAENNIALEVICEGDSNLLNQYGVIAVSPDMYPDVNNEAANAFIEWICSAEVQALIGEFGVAEYGEPLFTPNAK